MTSEEIREAMRSFSAVVYNGVEYKYISAYIYRILYNPNTGKYYEKFQVELMDYNGHSVTIANAKDVKVKERLNESLC